MILKKINYLISCVLFFILGNILAFFLYDRKYLRGKYFQGRLNGICSIGWKWVTYDAISRLLLNCNVGIKFPVSYRCCVTNTNNVIFHPDDLNNFQSSGIYYQAIGKIFIGHGTFIGPNVGLITSQHDMNNLKNHTQPHNITIGDNCWIGMNSVIMPGICLGNKTIVGAGSIVTKSFSEGNCVIVGNPAKKIRDL